MSEPRKYRWLTVGERYTYGPKQGKGDDSRRGAVCKVLTVRRGAGGPGNARVRFDSDGHIAIVPAGVLRKVA